MVRSSNSREVGSIQRASSKTISTGCWRARPSSWRISASSVRSFLRWGLRFGSGWRSEAGNDSRSAMNATSSPGGAAGASKASSLSSLAAGWICRCEPGRAAELVDKREQRALLVIGRAEIAQTDMGLGLEAPFQLCSDARLADAGLAGDQHDLAVSGLGAGPASQQQIELLVAADKGVSAE